MLKCCENNNQLDVNGRRVIFHINELRHHNEFEDNDSDSAQVSVIITEGTDIDLLMADETSRTT